jgi:hypothetical protein
MDSHNTWIRFWGAGQIPTDEVLRRLEIGELKRRACLEPPYREHLTTRFFYYHFRVALPEDHFVQPAAG